MKKYKLFSWLFAAVLVLGACGSDEKDGEAETEAADKTATADEEESNENSEVYEIGDTVEVESYEWEIPYQVTVNSFEQTQEYGGESMEDFLMNSGETNFLGIVNLTVKNTADEAIMIGEYVHPDVAQGDSDGAEEFVFDVSENDLSQEIQPGEEATFDLVYIMDSTVNNGYYTLKFETGLPTETKYKLPVE